MARTVSADATLNINVQDSDPQGTIATGGDVCTLNYSTTLSYTSSAPGSTRSWSTTLTLTAATTTLDLTALTGLRGTTETFSKVYALLIVNTTTTASKPIAVGNAAANAFSAFWSGATNTESVPSKGSRMYRENFDAGWTVDGTHKNLMLDPGANTCTATILIIGS